jgi:hypothetical protein
VTHELAGRRERRVAELAVVRLRSWDQCYNLYTFSQKNWANILAFFASLLSLAHHLTPAVGCQVGPIIAQMGPIYWG